VGSINYSQAIKPDTAYLKKIIENSLLTDWAIRIEYHGGESETDCWQLWDKTFFAIRSAENILRAIVNCYTKHPRKTIRIYAEKCRPQTRMLFTVYNPQYLPAETELKTQTTARQLTLQYDQPPTTQVKLTPQ
jgi:ribulose bisphosphate carboxylase small subunit